MTESSKNQLHVDTMPDVLLHQARQLTPQPSSALLARIEADARALVQKRLEQESAAAGRDVPLPTEPVGRFPPLSGVHGALQHVWQGARRWIGGWAWHWNSPQALRYLAIGVAALAIGLTGMAIGMTYSSDLLTEAVVQADPDYDLDDLMPGYGLDLLAMTVE